MSFRKFELDIGGNRDVACLNEEGTAYLRRGTARRLVGHACFRGACADTCDHHIFKNTEDGRVRKIHLVTMARFTTELLRHSEQKLAAEAGIDRLLNAFLLATELTTEPESKEDLPESSPEIKDLPEPTRADHNVNNANPKDFSLPPYELCATSFFGLFAFVITPLSRIHIWGSLVPSQQSEEEFVESSEKKRTFIAMRAVVIFSVATIFLTMRADISRADVLFFLAIMTASIAWLNFDGTLVFDERWTEVMIFGWALMVISVLWRLKNTVKWLLRTCVSPEPPQSPRNPLLRLETRADRSPIRNYSGQPLEWGTVAPRARADARGMSVWDVRRGLAPSPKIADEKRAPSII